MNTRTRYIACDQFGNTLFLNGPPRKRLLERLGRKHAAKIYIDRPDGAYHIGYIVSGHWYTILGLEGETFAKKAA